MACAKVPLELFKDHVSPHFYSRARERLRVEVLQDDLSNSKRQDLIVAPLAALKKLIKQNPGSVVPLDGYKAFMAGCGGFGGISRPFAVIAGTLAGLELTAGDADVPELPDFLDFLNDRRERYVLAATSRKALATHNKAQFFLLESVVVSVQHFMPMVPRFEAQHVIRPGVKTPVTPADKRVQVSGITRNGKRKTASFKLSFTNTSDKPIRGLQVFFFNRSPKAFRNAHAHVRFESRVNSVGPVAGYQFGDMLPGDTIARRIEYDLSGGNELSIAWNPAQAARMDDGGGWGNGCSTTKPDPIPDPLPIIFATTCYDAGCANSHCPPHECRAEEGGGCGCFSKS
jgi:hypothetical protein